MTHAAMTPRARRRAARSAPVRARARAALAMATLGIAAVAPSPAAGVAVERELAVMGTALRMRIEAGDRAAALRASEAVLAALAETEARLSTWRDDSELARLNAAPAGESVALSAATAAELAAAARCGIETEGAFEPAVGGLVDLWDLRGAGRIPGAAELAAALPASRPSAWRIDGARAARLHPATRLEEGGFGKGAGLDRALGALGGVPGVSAAWLDLGGQTALLGGGSWTVAVAHPDQRERAAVELLVGGGSVSTTGNGERGLTAGGRRIGHVLDPRTGEPAPDFGSLTVWAPGALRADCLSTGLYVLGPEAALAFAAAHPEVQVLALLRGEGGALTARASAGLAGRLRALAPELRIDVEEGRAASAPPGENAGATGRSLSPGGPAAP